VFLSAPYDERKGKVAILFSSRFSETPYLEIKRENYNLLFLSFLLHHTRRKRVRKKKRKTGYYLFSMKEKFVPLFSMLEKNILFCVILRFSCISALDFDCFLPFIIFVFHLWLVNFFVIASECVRTLLWGKQVISSVLVCN
jgi:hypothetical protein